MYVRLLRVRCQTMLPSLHALVILGTLIVPLIVIALSHGWHPRPIRHVLGFVAALAVMGAMCLLLLMPGVPIAEWLFPLIGIVLGVVARRCCVMYQHARAKGSRLHIHTTKSLSVIRSSALGKLGQGVAPNVSTGSGVASRTAQRDIA